MPTAIPKKKPTVAKKDTKKKPTVAKKPPVAKANAKKKPTVAKGGAMKPTVSKAPSKGGVVKKTTVAKAVPKKQTAAKDSSKRGVVKKTAIVKKPSILKKQSVDAKKNVKNGGGIGRKFLNNFSNNNKTVKLKDRYPSSWFSNNYNFKNNFRKITETDLNQDNFKNAFRNYDMNKFNIYKHGPYGDMFVIKKEHDIEGIQSNKDFLKKAHLYNPKGYRGRSDIKKEGFWSKSVVKPKHDTSLIYAHDPKTTHVERPRTPYAIVNVPGSNKFDLNSHVPMQGAMSLQQQQLQREMSLQQPMQRAMSLQQPMQRAMSPQHPMQGAMLQQQPMQGLTIQVARSQQEHSNGSRIDVGYPNMNYLRQHTPPPPPPRQQQQSPKILALPPNILQSISM